jgi:hypothetical protein
VIAALMFWQGGFLFYVAVVVPIGTEVLGSAAEQALITRRVTWQLNVTGAVALAIFAWDLFMTRRRTWGRRAAWLIMAVALVVLVVLHGHLDSMFLTDQLRVVDRPTFHFWHRTYLWVSTVQWAAAIAFAVLSLAAWRAEDRKPLIVSG